MQKVDRDTVVDPALFRLRAFEADWVARFRTGALGRLLVAESTRWMILGMRVGYFAESDVSELGPTETNDAVDALLDQALHESDLHNVEAFARELILAQEDLTPERRNFLYEILFAEDAEWRDRLSQARRICSRIASEPIEGIPPLAISGAAWLLEGRSSLIDSEAEWPGYWRSDDLPVLGALLPNGSERLEEVDEVLSMYDWATALRPRGDQWSPITRGRQTPRPARVHADSPPGRTHASRQDLPETGPHSEAADAADELVTEALRTLGSATAGEIATYLRQNGFTISPGRIRSMALRIGAQSSTGHNRLRYYQFPETQTLV
jgi:hypothetical protein